MIDSVEIVDRIAKCEKILGDNPHSQIFAALADAYRKKGDLQKAQEICTQGLKLHPDYGSARLVMAKILIALGVFDKAQEELQRAAILTGRTRAIDTLEAELLIRCGRKAEAASIIDDLSLMDPDDENVKNLKELFNQRNSSSLSIRPEAAELELPGNSDDQSAAALGGTLTLSRAISVLKIMPRVLGAAAVGRNGLLLEGRFDNVKSKEEYAALSKGIFDAAANGAEKTYLGQVREVLLETSTAKLWIFDRAKYTLVILTRDDVSMGALKLKIEELFENVGIGETRQD